MTSYKNAEFLVETNWLANNFDLPELRIFDCAALPAPNPDEALRKKYPLKPQSGRSLYEKCHITGAGFIDLPTELSDKNTDLPMMMPPLEQIVEVVTRAGIGDDTLVILYSSTNPMWAARVWWMLRAIGFNNAAILNGGLKKWLAEGHATSIEECTYTAARFTIKSQADIFVSKNQVLAAIDKNDTLLIHSLTAEVYNGNKDALTFGRRGRIPGSVNIPSGNLHDPETGAYLSPSRLRDLFESKQCSDAQRIITYCGGGINASNTAFALTLLGYDNITIYDGSMSEWGNDSSLPIEI
ncbi:3-mercaptopyruvate sulfurtransferase [hydrothermal vent metagenome]|uniref:3-mercaptopyruvate sulfurtransferase n=1 Tax=hydrothermal vent metagenome TaxID=652676 RepID=A0A3B0Y1A8_9ZZZZ